MVNEGDVQKLICEDILQAPKHFTHFCKVFSVLTSFFVTSAINEKRDIKILLELFIVGKIFIFYHGAWCSQNEARVKAGQTKMSNIFILL